jgi:hypothetical protein
MSLDSWKSELVNKTFGWLTVIDVIQCYLNGKKHGYAAVCKCKCGNIVSIHKDKLVSGHTKSCGCYVKSSEFSESQRQFNVSHPEIMKLIYEKASQWYNNNPDKVKESTEKRKRTLEANPDIQKEMSRKYSVWCNNNKKRIKERGIKHAEWCKEMRIKSFEGIDLSIIHQDDIKSMLAGDVKAGDKIRTRCPLCGEYEYHDFNNVINFKDKSVFRIAKCTKCVYSLSESKPETELYEYVAKIYSGECIRNTRDIIPPFELDLYYPEKKIAIEFNGDYWHNEDNKGRTYHSNKFLMCKQNGVLLVSVFESDWYCRRKEIEEYLLCLFNDQHSTMSFDRQGFMNNNYPCRECFDKLGDIIENFYTYRKTMKVYTCGYSRII